VAAIEVVDDAYTNGKLSEHTLDWYGQEQQGNVWYFGEQTETLPDHDTSGSWESGKNGAVPGIVIEGNPQPGDNYMQEYAPKSETEDFAQVIGFVDRVKVPYGTFTQVLETAEGSCVEDPAGQVAEHKYYAQGVGNIKTQTLDGSEVEQLVAVK
jgi:hypothetical protein